MNKKTILTFLAGAVFVFSLSAICLIVLTITKNTIKTNDILIDEQFLDSYVLEKIKRAKSVALIIENESDILMLDDGTDYVTYLYQSQGWLCDLYLLASQSFNPDYGDKICPVDNFDLKIGENILVVNGNYHLSLEGKL